MRQARPEWRDPAKERHWRQLLSQRQRSGLTRRDFCAKHHLSEPSFYAWKREIARPDQEQRAARQATQAHASRHHAQRPAAPASPVFVQVKAQAMRSSAPSALEVVLAGGRVVRLYRGFDAELLRQTLAVLEASPC